MNERVNSCFIQRLGHLWCALWSLGRHHNMGVLEKDSWYLRCINCGRRTAGWKVDTRNRPVPVTTKQIEKQQQELYDDIFSAEMEVHGGG